MYAGSGMSRVVILAYAAAIHLGLLAQSTKSSLNVTEWRRGLMDLMDANYPKDGLSVTLAKDRMRHFRCRVSRGHRVENNFPLKARSFSLYFSQGSAHTQDPTLADVLDCLASDAAGYENSNDFTGWADDLGYDTDSRKAEKIWRAVKRQAEQLKRTIGEEAYNDLLWNTERP